MAITCPWLTVVREEATDELLVLLRTLDLLVGIDRASVGADRESLGRILVYPDGCLARHGIDLEELVPRACLVLHHEHILLGEPLGSIQTLCRT